jgi:hypothetical protein
MGFFDEVVPVDFEKNILHPGRRSAVVRRLNQGAQDRPDFRPALADGLPQAARRMLRPKDRNVGIVIDLNELGAPPEKQGKPIGQKETGHHAQGGRPGLERAKRRPAPIKPSNQLSHFSSAGQEMG